MLRCQTREALLETIANLDGGQYHVAKTPDSAFLLALWHRLSHSQLADVREFAVQAILARDQAQYVYDHPELVKAPSKETRHLAVLCLVERGDKRAIPLLRTAFNDESSAIQVWAFRGLIKYKPDDTVAILRQGLNHKNSWIYAEALKELVRRGDKEATAEFLGRIAALKDHSHAVTRPVGEEFFAEEMCKLVIEQRLVAAKPALNQAYTNSCEQIQRPVSAALAALGDQDALKKLRHFARTGEPLGRWGVY